MYIYIKFYYFTCVQKWPFVQKYPYEKTLCANVPLCKSVFYAYFTHTLPVYLIKFKVSFKSFVH